MARQRCMWPSLQDRALEPEQFFLAIEPAGVADELAVRADHAVARQDDRQWVSVHHRADGARRPRTRRACGQLTVRDDFPVRDARKLPKHAAVEVREPCDVDGKVEGVSLALEILVELTPRGIDRLRRAQHAHAKGAREQFELALRVGVVGDPAEPVRARGDEQRADRRLDEVEGDVEQALRSCSLAEATIELGGDSVHESSFCRSRRMPAEAACLAAVAFAPSAAPTSEEWRTWPKPHT